MQNWQNGQKPLFEGRKRFPRCLNGGFGVVWISKSGLGILIRAPQVPFFGTPQNTQNDPFASPYSRNRRPLFSKPFPIPTKDFIILCLLWVVYWWSHLVLQSLFDFLRACCLTKGLAIENCYIIAIVFVNAIWVICYQLLGWKGKKRCTLFAMQM